MGRSSPLASLEEAAWRTRHKRDVDTQTPPRLVLGGRWGVMREVQTSLIPMDTDGSGGGTEA
jgi:hypothetical protein